MKRYKNNSKYDIKQFVVTRWRDSAVRLVLSLSCQRDLIYQPFRSMRQNIETPPFTAVESHFKLVQSKAENDVRFFL